jgi:hypothetical protein
MHSITMTCLLALSFTLSHQAFAAPWGATLVSKKNPNNKIYIQCADREEGNPCNVGILVVEINGKKSILENQPFAMSADQTNSYQERWGFFIQIYTEATLRMPSFPEMRYLWLISASKKAYRDGFKQMDRKELKNEEIKMRDLYFSKLASVLLEYAN